jgi:hypothetical protein
MAEPRAAWRPPYKNLLLVSGVLLVALGTGNWVVGRGQAMQWGRSLEADPGPRFPSDNLKTQLLEPPDEGREERDVHRAKLEFYQVVQSGGRLMVMLGALCLLGGLSNLAAARSAVRWNR